MKRERYEDTMKRLSRQSSEQKDSYFWNSYEARHAQEIQRAQERNAKGAEGDHLANAKEELYAVLAEAENLGNDVFWAVQNALDELEKIEL